MDIEEIESILNCPICMEEYNDPRILPCQHSFCEKCLSSYIKDLSKDKLLRVGSFPCPICRHKTKLRNNVDDASSFDKDLTKAALLDSKHILIQDDDSPDDSATCEAHTMTTQTDDGHDITDLQVEPDFPSPAFTDDNSKCENRKIPSKRKRKRALAGTVKNKEKRCNKVKTKKIKQKNNMDKQAKTDSNQGHNTDLEFSDYYLVYFVLIPLFTLSWKGLNKFSFLALFLALMLSALVVGFTYIVPYFSVLFFCIWLFSSYRQSSEILSLHCKVVEVRQYQIFLSCLWQYSIFVLFVISCLYLFVFTVSCKSTLSNALWRNDSVASLHEWEHHFYTYGSSWVNSMHIININVYVLMRQIVTFIFF